LLLAGPKGLERVVNALRVIAPELPFPIEFHEWNGTEGTIERNGYRIEAFRVNHNVPCYGYNIVIDRGGKFDVARANLAGIPKHYWSRLQHGETIEENGTIYTPDMVLGKPRKGIKVTYCTDSRPTPGIVEHAKKADLFICEGMYGEPGKEAKAVEYKHMTFREAAIMARDAAAEELWLTHFSPSMVRAEEFMEEVRQIFPNSKAGKDRKSVELDFVEA